MYSSLGQKMVGYAIKFFEHVLSIYVEYVQGLI